MFRFKQTDRNHKQKWIYPKILNFANAHPKDKLKTRLNPLTPPRLTSYV